MMDCRIRRILDTGDFNADDVSRRIRITQIGVVNSSAKTCANGIKVIA